MSRPKHARLRKLIAPGFSLLAATSLMGVGLTAQAATPGAQSLTQAGWHQDMRTLTVPSDGCFSGTYPELAWHRVACSKGPGAVPFAPSKQMVAAARNALKVSSQAASGETRVHPQLIGNGTDYSAKVTSGSISTATGSFPYESSGVTERGANGSGRQVANEFSLQLNTEFFSNSPACAGAASPGSCLGWQQFIYAAGYGVFMQYWLIGYNNNCPSGWMSDGSGDCYINSNSTSTANLSAGSLSKVTLTGNAAANGQDSVVLYNGTKNVSAVGSDSVVGLAGRWTEAEFVAVGNGGGSEANFSSGTTLDVKTSVNNGQITAPVCDGQGFTGETNNLSFAAAPALAKGAEPAIETQQKIGGAGGSCSTAS